MSASSDVPGSSREGNRGANERDEQMTWSIHAAPRTTSDDEGSESSVDGSEDGGTAMRQQRAAAEMQREQEHALRLAHAMTHNPVDALLPSPPRSPPRAIPNPYAAISSDAQHRRRRLITVNDLKSRTCWICSDGDEDENAQNGSTALRRRWIHPCRCTLVAHEDCLVTWIRTRRRQDPKQVITCPQCAQPYGIAEYKPGMLRLFEWGNKLIHDIVPFASFGVLGGGVLFLSTAYGCAAIRLWLGKEAAARTLGGRWPSHLYVDIPLIPFALILSRLRFVDHRLMWMPTLMAFPLLEHVPFFIFSFVDYFRWQRQRFSGQRSWDLRQKNHYRYNAFANLRAWPPPPGTTLFLVPWVRAMYVALKLRVTRRILRSFSRRHIATRNGPGPDARAARGGAADGQRRRMHLIVMAEDIPSEALDHDGTINVDENGNIREIPPGAEAVEGNRTTYVSIQSIFRLILGALGTPLIANVMGKFLVRCSRYSGWLRRFLGLEPPFMKTLYGFDSARHPKKPSGAASRTLFGNLFASGSIFSSEGESDSLERSQRRQTRALYNEDDDLMVGGPIRYDDLDPVWFRNTVGAGLFVVAKDVIQLTYRYLRLEHARQSTQRTKIIDKPFVGGIIDHLDLREQA